MSLPLSQQMSFDNETTIYNDEDNIRLTAPQSYSQNGISTSFTDNICCQPAKPIATDVTFLAKFIFSVVIIFAIVTITVVVVFFRYNQHLEKQKKKEKKDLEVDKTCAHPFEEFLIVVNDTKSIETIEIIPTTITN
ncbi:unnamed protein product [Adineta steineri]|uniref:Uncharacterized protein n=1 Tax=Adineta steineri TaxID=433720 RepID=A0A813YCL8_9BILA|nr:unnamed protein product [Adineta steineri]